MKKADLYNLKEIGRGKDENRELSKQILDFSDFTPELIWH